MPDTKTPRPATTHIRSKARARDKRGHLSRWTLFIQVKPWRNYSSSKHLSHTTSLGIAFLLKVIYMLRCVYAAVQTIAIGVVIFVYMKANAVAKERSNNVKIYVPPPPQASFFQDPNTTSIMCQLALTINYSRSPIRMRRRSTRKRFSAIT